MRFDRRLPGCREKWSCSGGGGGNPKEQGGGNEEEKRIHLCNRGACTAGGRRRPGGRSDQGRRDPVGDGAGVFPRGTLGERYRAGGGGLEQEGGGARKEDRADRQ